MVQSRLEEELQKLQAENSTVNHALYEAKAVGTEASLHKEEANRLREELARIRQEANDRIDQGNATIRECKQTIRGANEEKARLEEQVAALLKERGHAHAILAQSASRKELEEQRAEVE